MPDPFGSAGQAVPHLSSKTPAARIAAAAENNGYAVAMLARDVQDVRNEVSANRAAIHSLTIAVDALTDAFKAAKFAVTVLKWLGTVVAGIVAIWAALIHGGKVG